jgi:hypothetical protein
MDRAVSWANEQGLPGIRLETQSNNVGACRFYERYGFELAGYDRHLYSAAKKMIEGRQRHSPDLMAQADAERLKRLPFPNWAVISVASVFSTFRQQPEDEGREGPPALDAELILARAEEDDLRLAEDGARAGTDREDRQRQILRAAAVDGHVRTRTTDDDGDIAVRDVDRRMQRAARGCCRHQVGFAFVKHQPLVGANPQGMTLA